ncbi:hypothetical protein [Mucilaginibacter sp. UYCu711]|uniref:hypothetical protein n=1 Tax=Mucilaginibacter sp. UYCu711 TaxID=3156339 RepID=UPI003D1D0F4D
MEAINTAKRSGHQNMSKKGDSNNTLNTKFESSILNYSHENTPTMTNYKRLVLSLTAIAFSFQFQMLHAQSAEKPDPADSDYTVKVGQQAPTDFLLKLTDGSTPH